MEVDKRHRCEICSRRFTRTNKLNITRNTIWKWTIDVDVSYVTEDLLDQIILRTISKQSTTKLV